MQKYSLLLLLLLVFTACVKPVKIIIPESENSLVVNGLLFKDTILNIRVRKTQPILGELDTNLTEEYKNAKVKLYENNILIDSALYQSYLDTFTVLNWKRPVQTKKNTMATTLEATTGIRYVEGYIFPKYLPKEKTHYKIEVSSPNYPTAIAESYLPATPKVSNVQVDLHANIQDLYSQSYLTFDLEDTPNERNNYFIKVRALWHWENNWAAYLWQQMPIFGDNNYLPLLSGDINTTKSRDYVAISDTDFDGQKKQVRLMLRTNYKRKNSNLHFEYVRFVVSVYSVSEEYFDYMTKYNLVKKLGLDLGVLDATPVIMPNSVKNGYGLLGGYVVGRDSIVW
jgi:hypothetical protein